jgi:hypothetical protein
MPFGYDGSSLSWGPPESGKASRVALLASSLLSDRMGKMHNKDFDTNIFVRPFYAGPLSLGFSC